MIELECETCHGSRLDDSVLSVLVGNKNIYEVTKLSIKQLIDFFNNLELTEQQQEIGELLNNIHDISGRDENSYNIVKELTKKSITYNLDPVLVYDFKLYADTSKSFLRHFYNLDNKLFV